LPPDPSFFANARATPVHPLTSHSRFFCLIAGSFILTGAEMTVKDRIF
jgi:hypothetical protein